LVGILASQVLIAIEIRKVGEQVNQVALLVDKLGEMLLRVLPAGPKQ
jgi:hypothetical protein